MMKKFWQAFLCLLLVAGFFLSSAAAADLTIGNYTLISEQRVSRTEYNYTFKAVISNSGIDVNNVKATLTSTSPYTTVVEGSLFFGDVLSGQTVESSDTFIVKQNRRYPFDESALTWNFQYDLPPQTSVAIEAGLSVVNIPVGSSQNIAYVVTFNTNSNNTYTIDFEQYITPDTTGISLSTDFTPGWTTNTSNSWPVNETIQGLSVGSYEIATVATVAETGQTVEVKTIVNVLSGDDEPVLENLGSSPDAINATVSTEVLFTCMISNSDTPPTSFIVEEIDEFGNYVGDLGQLNDDGLLGDKLSNDNVFSGNFNIISSTPGKKYYRAKATYQSGPAIVYSDEYAIAVTNFPIGIQPADLSKVVIDPDSGDRILSNEILVTFVDGTDTDLIESIVSDIGGAIVGTSFGVQIFQINIPDSVDASGVYSVINNLLNYSEVESAEPINIGKIGAVTPSDTFFNLQWGLTKIRADEAWVVARGNVLIAILDTGVNYDHPDLDSKVIKGKNYITNNNDPKDDHSHGSHCAGIAASETNNSAGIAGVSWNSKILAVKVCDSGGDCPKSYVADGIKYAADNGAKIISLSLSYETDIAFTTIPSPLPPYFIIVPTDSELKKAVDYATNKGCLVVAAAGNDGNSWKNYPAGYTNVISVGNTTSTDTRQSDSCYGSWVDIAAPGTGIYSTVLNTDYGYKTGTSMSTPMVAGAAAVVWGKHPSWNAAQVRERLEKTAKPLPGLELGAGRLDLFEAVFNGSFEIDDLSEWSKTGTASSLSSLGSLVPVDRNGHKKRFGYVSTGPAADYVSSRLSQTLQIQNGVSSIPITFDYNFITEEYPEFVGSIYDDALTITLQTPSGNTVILATESVNGSSFSSIGGIDFPGGDNTVGMTGWKSSTVNVPVSEGAGKYQIFIEDAGDDIYDSVVLIDNIRFK